MLKEKIGMTREERDARRLTDEVKNCPKCKQDKPFKQFSTKVTRGLHYLAAECNKCQYKRKLKKHGGMTQSYNKTQIHKERNTVEGRAARLRYNCKNRARLSRRDIEFDLTKARVIELLKPMKCNVTGVDLILGDSNPYSPSVDRIDNSKGYTNSNVQIVAQMYNFCKNEFTDAETIEFLKKVKV